MALLRYAMIGIGVIFVVGIWTLASVWPSGWSWGTGPSHYWPMILGVYATLGVFLVWASRDPLANRGLIWFTVWSSVVHAVVMAVSAVTDRAEVGHLVGDVPALLLVAAALAILTRRAEAESSARQAGARRAA
jgi:FtsH-binding integral membrane protein